MENLGKATVKVELLDSLPNIRTGKSRHNFDITAHSWPVIQNSPYFSPFLTENVVDGAGWFSACHPTKRKLYVNNVLKNSDGTFTDPDPINPLIVWTPIDTKEGVVSDIISEGEFDDYTLIQPGDYTNAPGDYTGPYWIDKEYDNISKPNDEMAIKRWLEFINLGSSASTAAATTTPDDFPKGISYALQDRTLDGLWWELESESFVEENMPFWVNIKRKSSPPSSTHETVIVISIGIGSNTNAFDLYLSNNNKPRIIDYIEGREASAQPSPAPSNPPGGSTTGSTNSNAAGAPTIEKEFDLDLSRLFDSEEEIEVGFMTITGRLVVFVNKLVLVYTRINKSDAQDESGTIAEAKIAPGAVRVFGTNVKAAINATPMTFAVTSVMALPVPTIPPTVDPNTGAASAAPDYKGVNNDGTYSDSVAHLPKDESPDDGGFSTLFGGDCSACSGDGGSATPDGFGMHQDGTIQFKKASSVGLTTLSSSDFYLLIMKPDDTTFNPGGRGEKTIENGGCPYFFRLKGGADTGTLDFDAGVVDVTGDVISVTQNAESDGYFSILNHASVTLYNKGGTYDYLKTEQRGVRLSFGWSSSEVVRTFTGISIAGASSETPGKETITLQCEDYMYILKNTPIVNSPFYDGILMFHAVKDIVLRAGVQNVTNDWDSTDEYFLPSGYSFSQPKFRFPSKNMLYECALDFVKRGEATVYFDADGTCIVKKLPGGLFSVGAGAASVASFSKNPDGDVGSVILDERAVEGTMADTANKISILTLDRDTRNAIVYSTSPATEGIEDKIMYQRVILIDQPAYGEYAVAVAYASELAIRVFNPIRKTSFKTIGGTSTILPLDFVTVEGQEFRLMSLRRTYEAESNSLETQYECEWLGG
jgi:hypothetical protein